MKTKLLYVLVCSPADIYADQAYLSMMSAHRHIPDVKITLLADAASLEFLKKEKRHLLQLVSEVVAPELEPSLSGQYRSRLLKTGARDYVRGDYLFVDCDTLVLRDLSAIDSCDGPLLAVRDSHSPFATNPYRGMIESHCRKLGFRPGEEQTYFNSGVFYVADTPEAHEFYRLWRRLYIEGRGKGVFMDQPSFAKANAGTGYMVRELPDVWNCQLKHGIRYLKDAQVLHYLCTNKSEGNEVPLFRLNDEAAFHGIGAAGEVPDSIAELMEDPFKGIAECVDCVAGGDMEFLSRRMTRLHRELYYTLFRNGAGGVGRGVLKLMRRILRKLHIISR